MSKYNKYVMLKSKFEYIYKGIYINRILAPMIWSFANSNTAGFRWTSSALIFCAADVERLKYDSQNHIVFSTFSPDDRKDYKELYYSVINKLGGRVSINELALIKHKYAFTLNSIRNLFHSFRLSLRLNLTLTQKWKLAVYTTYYCNTIDKLETLDLFPKRYLSMFNTAYLENLLTQFFKRRGIKTYSLQEGIYHIFEHDFPIDVIQYENLETDNLLCWGQYSVEEYKRYGIDMERLHTVGYPKSMFMEDLRINESLHKCVVLLSRDNYLSTNLRVIDLLSEYSDRFDFYLKLHPAADYEFYNKLAKEKGLFMVAKDKTVNECLDNHVFDFGVAVNTTAYYESLLRGLPCLRYYDGSYDLTEGLDDIFDTPEGFLEQIERLSCKDIMLYKSEVVEMLKYVLGYSVDKYAEVILT